MTISNFERKGPKAEDAQQVKIIYRHLYAHPVTTLVCAAGRALGSLGVFVGYRRRYWSSQEER